MAKNSLASVSFLLALVLFLGVNLFARTTMRGVRADLTEHSLYTLSKGTRNILANLGEPVTLRFFYSSRVAADIPPIKDYADRILELLEEYAALSSGKVKLEIIEPVQYSEEEDRAVSFGIQGLPVNQAGDKLFFGLAGTNSVDDEEVIPFFSDQREEFLEYDLTQLVDNLSNLDAKKVVGLLTSLPLRGGPANPMNPQAPPAQPWIIVQQIEQSGFEVRDLDAANLVIDDEIDVLLLVHPKGLSEQARYTIDQYVLGGGKTIVFVDPHADPDPGPPGGNQMMADKSSSLDDLLGAWGLEMVSGKLAGDMKSAEQVRPQSGAGSVPFALWPRFTSDNMNEDDVTTSNLLRGLTMRYPGILRTKADATTTVEALIRTTGDSMEVDTFHASFPQPDRLIDDFIPSGEEMIMAARITGTALTAFPGGKPGAADEDPMAHDHDGDGVPDHSPEEHVDEDTPADADEASSDSLAEGQINAIVVADVDMLYDQAWVRAQNLFGSLLLNPTADNADFLINAIDNMCGSDDLISLRSRGRYQRPFDKKRELEREADERFRAEEQALEAKLQETETKLNELQFSEDGSGRLILSPEQQAEIEGFRVEQLDTRKKLREVKLELRKSIESLGKRLKFANILLLPLLIGLGALSFTLTRRRR